MRLSMANTKQAFFKTLAPPSHSRTSISLQVGIVPLSIFDHKNILAGSSPFVVSSGTVNFNSCSFTKHNNGVLKFESSTTGLLQDCSVGSNYAQGEPHIQITGATVSLRNVRLEGNVNARHVSVNTGQFGVINVSPSPTLFNKVIFSTVNIENCIFSSNFATSHDTGVLGSVLNIESSIATIKNTQFFSNRLQGSIDPGIPGQGLLLLGAAIHVTNSQSTPLVSQTTTVNTI